MEKSSKILFVLAAVLFFSGCSVSGPNTSGSVPMVVEKTYAVSKSIWKSGDGGISWEAKDESVGKPRVKDLDVLSIAINSKDPRNIYVGLRSGGIIKTEDGGEKWSFLNFSSQKAYGIVLDEADPSIIYASGVLGNRGKIWKTEDKGENWREIYSSASDGPLVVGLASDRGNPHGIYAATSDNQLIRSRDGGFSWENIFVSSNPIIKIFPDSAENGLIYFMSNDGKVYRSQNFGEDIDELEIKYSERLSFSGNFSVLRVDPSVSKRVYLAGKGGIIRSSDAGETWEKITALSDPESFPITAFAVSPQNPAEMIYGAGQATFRSADGGVNWSTFQFDTERKIRFLEYNPNNGSVVYIGFNK